ncbi:hypothetical protein CDAR_185551 [Caerostris darwini]|uniref:Uncharacterized protein n=1 Tax=Caerostris darwini TaxID=1538125 RepID=A0AAV4NGZ3_9ARAC|nr:hypothetical protein CDAR_185551 [Caerostris darwini]
MSRNKNKTFELKKSVENPQEESSKKSNAGGQDKPVGWEAPGKNREPLDGIHGNISHTMVGKSLLTQFTDHSSIGKNNYYLAEDLSSVLATICVTLLTIHRSFSVRLFQRCPLPALLLRILLPPHVDHQQVDLGKWVDEEGTVILQREVIGIRKRNCIRAG